MFKHHLIITTCLLFFKISVFAQNLILNSSFEETTNCNFQALGAIDTNYYNDSNLFRSVKNWVSPNNGTPDYYNRCQPAGGLSVPSNIAGYQPARTGNAYAGIILYDANGLDPAFIVYREYLQTKLTEPLQKFKNYCITYYVSPSSEVLRGDNNIYTNDFHTALTPNRFKDYAVHPVNPNDPYAPVMQPNTYLAYQGSIINDTSAWTKIQMPYQAKGGEQWLTLGNFKTNAQTAIQIIPYTYPPYSTFFNGYYFIDDVSVVEISNVLATRDTTTCAFPLTLTAQNGFDTYLWSNGATTQTTTITQPGTYTVAGTLQECGTVIDTIIVRQQNIQTTSSRDTTACLPMRLTAYAPPLGVGGYLWNTNETTQNITIATAGTYYVKRNIAACSTKTDMIHVYETQPPTPLHFPDTTLCTTDLPIRYTVPDVFTNIQWSDNTTENPKDITKSGVFSLSANWQCGTLRDTFRIKTEAPLPPIRLLTQDTTSCHQGRFVPFRLYAPYGYPNYIWHVGATLVVAQNRRSILIEKEGSYFIQSENICGEVTDEIKIEGCPPNYYIPNTFTPNGDGQNDVLEIYTTDAIVAIENIQIFNRWGELIVLTDRLPSSGGAGLGAGGGWDGTFRGQDAPSDVYVYIIVLQFADGTTETVTGDVTLLR